MKQFQFTFSTIVLSILMIGCVGKSQTTHIRDQTTIVDMAGRKVKLPATIERIFCADWTCTMFVYSLAPDKLVARNSESTEQERLYTLEAFQHLPSIGVVFNGRSTINLEELTRLNPDIIVCPLFQHTQLPQIAEYERVAKLLNKPFVMVNLDIEQLPNAYEFMGNILGCKPEGEKLKKYCVTTLAWADSVRHQIRTPKTVYVAEGSNGLNTIPKGSTHAQTLTIAGVDNCADVDQEYGFRDITIGFEQIIGWDPEYVIINSRSAEQTMNMDEVMHGKWQTLTAVKNHHILVTPTAPFNWIGRPPGINRLLGIKWLAWSLYPDIAKVDMQKEIAHFFELFYHISPTKEQIEQITHRSKLE